MNELWFALILFLSSVGAGLLGALSGLGGGVVIVPLLTVVFHVDIRYAIGASLVSVIATSSGAAAAYVREGFSNIRVGMFLEIATTLGALVGAWLTTRVPTKDIGIVFGVVLLYSAWASLKKTHETFTKEPDAMAVRLRLEGELPVGDGVQPYVAQRVPLGFGLMWLAGALSGLLGIGSGAVKVLAMDQAMRLPFKVSTTTSNFMIGVTAAASAGLYWRSGYLTPSLVFPVMLGVLAGSLIGSRVLVKARVHTLKLVFSLLIVAMGIEMIINNVLGK
ncbi:MAG TPA: sulfite exporter TauE/SafE family protein [Acidobacteriaceae bacterium]|nr:sulfite exporter TauE/SafE family protein [Acidobacteriaceae bacterium]